MQLGGEPDVVVEKAVEGFRAAGEFVEIALQCFGERIEEAPDVPGLEVLMTWHTPFMQHQREVAIWADTDIQGTNHEIVGRAVVEVGEFVVGDATILMVPALHQPAHGALDEAGQITQDEPGVLAGEFDLPVKREIVAAKHG